MNKTTKIIVGIICLLLAVVIVLVAVPLVSEITANKAEVVQVLQDVQKGKNIKEEDLTVVEISMNNMREDIALKKDLTTVIGQYALVDLKRGDFITGDKVGSTTNESDQAIAALPTGKEAYSIKFSGLDASVSSKIQAGDIVRCYITSKEDNTTTVDKSLQYLKVLTVTDSTGVDTDNVTSEKDKKKVSQTITFALSPVQIKKLASYYKGAYSLSFSIIYRGNNTEADSYVIRQDKIIQSLNKAKH